MAREYTFPLKPWRAVAAFVAATPIPALIMATMFFLWDPENGPVFGPAFPTYEVGALLACGIPAFVLCRRKGWDRRIMFIGAGLVAGMGTAVWPFLDVVWVMARSDPIYHIVTVVIALLGVLPGVIAGIVFWYVLYGGLRRTELRRLGRRAADREVEVFR